MLTSIHFILTYKCNFECDHCFLYCHPFSKGTFSIQQIKNALDEFKRMGTVTSVGFEGGEAFLFYPILLESVRMATRRGFKTALQTNCYWATSKKDAMLWLKPLHDSGLCILEVSDDTFHHGEDVLTPAKQAISAAKKLGLTVDSICIKKPEIKKKPGQKKGDPIYLGGPKLRGRAVDKLTDGLPTKPWKDFIDCPFEDLRNPKRVHIDPFGNVHLCQGISMGNMWETPLTALVKNYEDRKSVV